MNLSYIIPVYNEQRTLDKSIQDIIKLPIEKEIIIIDNGSTDGSVDIIKKYQYEDNINIIYKQNNLGFGDSIQKGFDLAKGKYIFIQYADLEYDHLSSLSMLNLAFTGNLDVIFGSRLKNEKNILKILSKKPSYLATIICTFLINFFYKKKFTDIIGTKLYKKNSIKKILPKTKGQGFDFELVSLICKNNLKIEETYVEYVPRANSTEKKIKFYHMFNALYAIFKIKYFYRIK
jgi:glycosyltransferase involved in cell wall biosynthesis|tara:strand:- start:1953 stop:2651 length:699 start_codon:yes stop_codon:yes gene_type:complete